MIGIDNNISIAEALSSFKLGESLLSAVSSNLNSKFIEGGYSIEDRDAVNAARNYVGYAREKVGSAISLLSKLDL